MDSTSLTIGIILLIVCVLPFILFSVNNSKKRKKRIQNLIKKAQENNATIQEKDDWNQSIIGIDKTNKMLFFSKKSEEFDKFISINISELLKCRIERTENKHNVLEKLELELTFASRPTIVLEFFNKDETRLILNEIEIIQKWQTLLNKIT
ncbi:hypothetical protein G6N05_03955 [Flavobacterium sp. F372]|jgi:hypothetical protein|uniref:Uncharacterized protein n=1 Tax=Flavobacterium bernardetii TaxID=2813823 RepID=A0ABR7IW71_9FLAO|nr:hypothetical protein [Flavobacterium bernardetii]MBC5834029.1 hypothetical protein [Flavobacterium bernardetii]NHF69261.1 hypothetical protein [Flavobacterium bernardetii]